MWNVRDVGCWRCGMLEMWDIGDVGCSGCGMLEMWDVRDVGCWGFGLLGMWDVWDVGCSGCSGCGMFAGMWDVDLQNAQSTKPCQQRCTIEVFGCINWHTKQSRQNFVSIVLAKEEDDWVQANLKKLDFDAFWENKISQKMYNDFLDCRENMKDGEPLQKFWMIFLEMVELLLNTIYAIRAWYWELLLECIRNILPYTFAYDNINYARYLSAILGEMLQLPKDFPEV